MASGHGSGTFGSLGGNLRSIDSVVNDWPHIQTKAMVLGGEEDGPNFPENARRAAESLPNAELVLIPNVGHNPHEEVPEIVNAELIRFLSSDPDETRFGGLVGATRAPDPPSPPAERVGELGPPSAHRPHRTSYSQGGVEPRLRRSP